MKRFAFVMLVAVACAKQAEPPPGCEPPPPTSDNLYRQVAIPGWDAEELARDIAAIHTAIESSQGAGAPPSKEFNDAKRAYDAKKWIDAAQGFREVAKRNGTDDRATRQTAQYWFAVALLHLKFTTEAGAILRDVRSKDGHPKQTDAATLLTAQWCER